ncbi:hypothetical protein GCM10009718_36010 [Isoptericola halotolerans]|uniref:Uncharacterized protein n=1 Tax=Isoptericola halotolerans TaxID=300560 RepID=A0ABX2A6L8_9MICO|nr:hypothetical protein [Isoptericola halotolerans]NOV97246.1 hypothetical protein [Isoptericola halotolerans]
MITLLKHEVVQTRAMLGLVGLVALLVTAVGALFAATGWPALAPFGLVLVVAAAFGLVPAAQIVLAVAYWRSGYGRMGHLTHTFPVRGSTIYWAKTVWAWAVSLLGVALSVGLVLAASPLLARGLGTDRGDLFRPLREGWALLAEMAPVWGIAAAAAALVVLVLIWPVQYFFAASVGSQAPLNRLGVGGPVIVWFGVYFVTQVLTFVSFAAVPFAVGSDGERLAIVRFDLFAEMMAGTSAEVMPIGFLPSLLLITVVCIGWTVHSWNRRVSLV